MCGVRCSFVRCGRCNVCCGYVWKVWLVYGSSMMDGPTRVLFGDRETVENAEFPGSVTPKSDLLDRSAAVSFS